MRFRQEKYKRLIIKFIQGETTPDEQRIAQAWIAEKPENQQLYESYKGLMLLTGKKAVQYDTNRAWDKLQKRMSQAQQQSPPTVRLVYDRKKLMVKVATLSGMAAVLIMAIAFFTQLNKPTEAPANLQVASNQSVSNDFTLPDGSTIVLNTNSTINYPERFTGDSREISIFGEAFFEVLPDAAHPFIIHASGLDIRVVGTSFNIEAYPGSDFVKVTVNTGKVLVYPNGTPADLAEEAGKLLRVGEVATFSRETGQILKGVNDDLNFLSWKTGVLTFRESRLAEVFKALETKYHTRFVVENPEILNERLTARFEQETLDQVLETLSLIFQLQLEVGDSQVVVH